MQENERKRPFVVCHMLTSLDGKIDGEFFTQSKTAPALKAYGDLREYYGCQATLYGTTTMLGGYADGMAPPLPNVIAPLPQEDAVNPLGRAMNNFIVSVDPEGILGFSSHILEKKRRPPAHLIEVLTEKVSAQYPAYLAKRKISYLFAGRDRLDCGLLLKKLAEKFGITRLMVAGGGTVNWSFLQEGVIDELSLVIAPVADGGTDAVSIFERADFLPPHPPAAFALKGVKVLEGDTLWLRYRLL